MNNNLYLPYFFFIFLFLTLIIVKINNYRINDEENNNPTLQDNGMSLILSSNDVNSARQQQGEEAGIIHIPSETWNHIIEGTTVPNQEFINSLDIDVSDITPSAIYNIQNDREYTVVRNNNNDFEQTISPGQGYDAMSQVLVKVPLQEQTFGTEEDPLVITDKAYPYVVFSNRYPLWPNVGFKSASGYVRANVKSDFTDTISSNGPYTITVPQGFCGISGGTITVNVPTGTNYNLEPNKAVTLLGGSHEVTPTSPYDAMSKVTAIVPVKNDYVQNITSNGTHNITLPSGYAGISGGTINVSVANPPTALPVACFTVSTDMNYPTSNTMGFIPLEEFQYAQNTTTVSLNSGVSIVNDTGNMNYVIMLTRYGGGAFGLNIHFSTGGGEQFSVSSGRYYAVGVYANKPSDAYSLTLAPFNIWGNSVNLLHVDLTVGNPYIMLPSFYAFPGLYS